MFRHWRFLARNAGDAIRARKRARIRAPLELKKRVLALEEAPFVTSSLLHDVQGRASPFGPCRMVVRGAANDALDIVRFLEGAEDENDEPGTRRSGSGEDPGADEIVENVVKFEKSSVDSGANEATENGEEDEFSDSDYDFDLDDDDTKEDESAENGEGNGSFSDSDDDIKEKESAEFSEGNGSFSDLDEEVVERYSDSDSEEMTRLKPHADGMYRKVIDAIAHPEALAAAFENIKAKYGKVIFRSQESVDWRWCEQTADELRAGTYAFHPVRLVNVPVLGSEQKIRSIRVVSPKDQIVLEAFRAVIEKIFAHSSPHVHSCKHTALEQVKYGWRGTSWFMEFSVEKSYDETNQKRLKNILSEKMQDQRFMDTLFQMFNAGVIGLERTGVEEGGILSSLLCSIYYQKLDDEVEAIMKEWNSGAKDRRINPAYRRLMMFDKSTLARIGANADQMKREKQHRLAVARKLAISRKNYKDPDFTRIQYVRFGDNFLLGLSGSKSTGLKIMKRLTTFLQSNLQLQVDLDNTRLGHAVSDKTLFLGAYIRVLDPKELPEVSSSLIRAVARKRAQTMRVKQQLEDRWTRECRNVVLKCWTVAFAKWRRELGKDGAKKKTFEAATQQLLSMPDEDSLLWREKAQDVLHVFISAALRQGLFPQDEVENYYKVLASLEKSLTKVPQLDFEEDLDV